MSEPMQIIQKHHSFPATGEGEPHRKDKFYSLSGFFVNGICFLLPFGLLLILSGCSQSNIVCPEDEHLALAPAPLEEEWALEWWMPRHREKLDAAGRDTVKLLFLGDSITQGWETAGKDIWDQFYAHYGALNLGFSGDRTENVLWRLEHGQVDGINPALTVLMIGTNNTGHRQDSAQCTARGVEMILEELRERLPDTRVLLLAIFPRSENPDDPLRQLNNEINSLIANLADNRQVFFLDINEAFLDEEGWLPEEVMPDMLHPNEHGYALWAEAMESRLNELLRGD